MDEILSVQGTNFIALHKLTEPSPPTGEFQPHIHDIYEMIFILRGNVCYTVEGKTYSLRKGDLVLTRPSVFHDIQPDHTRVYERFNIAFDSTLVPEQIIAKIPRNIDVFGFADNIQIFDLFSKIDKYAESLPSEALSDVTESLIKEVLYNTMIPDNFVIGQNASNPLINKAIEYIDKNLTTITGVSEICDALYITKSHLHHLFGIYMRIPPKQYITSKRLLLAQRMIHSGIKSTEAAARVGFDDYATFFRNYKRRFGYNPSEGQERKKVINITDTENN